MQLSINLDIDVDDLANEIVPINEYQYGFINPENDKLYIHELDTETLRIMFECD